MRNTFCRAVSVLYSCKHCYVPTLKKRKTEGGRTFSVSAFQLWTSLSLNIWKQPTVKSFRNFLRNQSHVNQQLLAHFNIKVKLAACSKTFSGAFLIAYSSYYLTAKHNVNLSETKQILTISQTTPGSRFVIFNRLFFQSFPFGAPLITLT